MHDNAEMLSQFMKEQLNKVRSSTAKRAQGRAEWHPEHAIKCENKSKRYKEDDAWIEKELGEIGKELGEGGQKD